MRELYAQKYALSRLGCEAAATIQPLAHSQSAAISSCRNGHGPVRAAIAGAVISFPIRRRALNGRPRQPNQVCTVLPYCR